MKISFLLVSMALHASALAYPALFLDSRVAAPIIVTLLETNGGSGNGGTDEGSAPQKKPIRSTRKAAPEMRQEQSVAEAERIVARPEQLVELPKTISTAVVATDAPGGIVISARQSAAASVVENSSPSSGGRAEGVGGTGGSGGGGGNGGGGSGLNGIGPGSGDGRGSGNGGSPFLQVQITYSPMPEYPDSARKAGWQGTVTLRVLVDEEGKSKSVEVYQSSGFALLDQAAVETVRKRWRFYPAREGEKQVENRIRIPIEFSLRNLKKN